MDINGNGASRVEDVCFIECDPNDERKCMGYLLPVKREELKPGPNQNWLGIKTEFWKCSICGREVK